MNGMEGFLQGLQLPDLWQQEAVRHLKAGRDVILDAPTGAGKTFVFESYHEGAHRRGQSVYTVPTRALANDKRTEWKKRGWNVGIATGDLAENVNADVLVATLETQRERLLSGDGPALLVLDEYQMIADPVRGLGYELALALAPAGTQLLLMSGSVSNAAEVRDWLIRLGREAVLVSTKVRPVPLDEVPVETLPSKAPRQIEGFWPRLAVEVLLANLGPLLIFAPKRGVAEKIARQIAMTLPADDPLVLTERQQQVCGKELSALLEKRVAVHHSGLSYQQRAGVIEPLAKAGKLRVVVATMGLAAGINFSMRSVVVADRMYFDGRQEKLVSSDELLQMFGRAGRRGLDTVGMVITTRQSPGLGDAAPVRLKRGRELDWPPLLRVMQLAAERGGDPFAAAEKLAASLFSPERVLIGMEADAPGQLAEDAPPVPEKRALFGMVPTVHEVQNSKGQWEELDATRWDSEPLSEAFVFHHQHLEPALESYPFVAGHFSVGRICRLKKGDSRAFGREVALALQQGPKQFVLTRNIRAWLTEGRDKVYSYDQIEDQVIPKLLEHFEGGRVVEVVQRGEILTLRLDFSRKKADVYIDSHGVFLVNPEQRERPRNVQANIVDPASGRDRTPRSDTPAYAWRKLGLIEANGHPTRRGVVTSFFHHGEGLAVAAALEETTLPMDELLPLLANLRAGTRFSEDRDGRADRLAYACREAYGTADYEGYLSLGLPVGYGEGAAEVVEELRLDPHAKKRLTTEWVGEGDVERAVIEWLSLLRHIVHAPDFAWDGWQALKLAAAAELEKYGSLTPGRTLPEMPPAQLVHRVDHHLTFGKLRW